MRESIFFVVPGCFLLFYPCCFILVVLSTGCLPLRKPTKQKDKEDLEEIVNELELVDEEEKVPFVFFSFLFSPSPLSLSLSPLPPLPN